MIFIILIVLIILNITLTKSVIDILKVTKYNNKIVKIILLIPPVGMIVYTIIALFFALYWIYDTLRDLIREIWN